MVKFGDAGSLFNLPTALESDGGGTNAGHRKITANRSFDNANFSNGLFQFDIVNPMHRWWHPDQSYFRIRMEYGLAATSAPAAPARPIQMRDKIALSQNTGDHMFQTAEYQISGSSACKIYQHMPQIGAIRRRMRDNSHWQRTVGQNLNFEASSFWTRQRDTACDGHLSEDARPNQYPIIYPVADAPDITYVVIKRLLGGANRRFWLRMLDENEPGAHQQVFSDAVLPGDIVEFPNGTARIKSPFNSRIQTGFTEIEVEVEETAAIVADEADNTDVFPTVEAGVVKFFRRNTNGDEQANRVCKEVEICFQLPLPIFDQAHGLPGGKHTFILNPHTQNQLMKSVFQSIGENYDSSKLFINVKEFYFMAFCIDNEAPSTSDILLDFKQMRLQTATNLTLAGAGQKQIDVRPTTSAIIMAFQDTRVTNDTMFAEAELKAFPAGGPLVKQTTNIAHALERYSIEYAGTQYPVPDADFKLDTQLGINTWTQAYLSTVQQTGVYDLVHPESMMQWFERGPYFHHLTLRPGLDRSTRVTVNMQWNNSFKARGIDAVNGPTIQSADFANLALLIVDVSRQALKIQVRDGEYSQVVMEEV